MRTAGSSRITETADGPASARTAGDQQRELPRRVRTSSARVAAVSRWVRLDEERLVTYAAELAAEDELDAPSVPPEWTEGDHEQRAGLVLALASVNFGSGWHPLLRKDPGLSGARTVAARFTKWWMGRGGLRAAELERLTTPVVAGILGQDDAGQVGELIGLFTEALRGLSRWVEVEHGGWWRSVVEAADGSACQLAGSLVELPMWNDHTRHPEAGEVWLAKRAQLAAADLALSGVATFADLGELTIMADNLVPHVLRLDGVLQVHPDLVARIDAEELLQPGEPAEVELRACAVHASERLVGHLAEAGRPITAAELDRQLWWRGRLPRYKSRPRHRARSTWY